PGCRRPRRPTSSRRAPLHRPLRSRSCPEASEIACGHGRDRAQHDCPRTDRAETGEAVQGTILQGAIATCQVPAEGARAEHEAAQARALGWVMVAQVN